MLNEKEIEGISVILRSLKAEDLRSLVSTVTNYMVVPETVGEAIQVICLYTPSASSILKRKKIKKEIIFKYLYNEGHVVLPTVEKAAMIKVALGYWDSNEQFDSLSVEDDYSTEEVETQENTSFSTDIQIIEEMGKKFTIWFYTVWRAAHPSFSENGLNEKFGPHHFWPDCQCHLEINTSLNQVSACDFSTNQDVAKYLEKLLIQDNIIFNPNVGPGGIKAKMDNHGLVIILVSGTLHHLNTCIGIFEQTFGLIEEIGNSGRWKIKYTNIRLQHNVNGAICSNLAH